MNENKMFCDRCNKEINNPFIYISEIDHQYLCDNCFEKEQPKALAKQIDQLKQQFAEKDKEIEKLKQQYTILENENGKLTTELIMDKYKKAQKEVSFGKQLAIQELEKVKEEFGLKSGWSSETDMCFDLEQFIKQQIKELKGE